jgi:predicted RNase H-like HicB family nuclease
VTDDEDAESPYFVAEYRELPGCFTVGNSRSEALANLKDVFDEWIEAKLEWGSAIPEPERLGRGNFRRGGISIA